MAPSMPWRLVGYRPETDAEGQIVLFAQRSPLDVKAEEIVCHPAILKQVVAHYLLLETAAELRPIQSDGAVIPEAARLAAGIAGAIADGMRRGS